MGTDADGEQDDSVCGGGLGCGGIEQKGERTHGHGQQCDDCWGQGCKGTKW